MKLQWEKITDNTFRLRIDGGWLYRYGSIYDCNDHTMVFVSIDAEARE